jgi:hypothetical protein
MVKTVKCDNCQKDVEVPAKPKKLDNDDEDKKCSVCQSTYKGPRKAHNSSESHNANSTLLKKIKLLIQENKQDKIIKMLDKK